MCADVCPECGVNTSGPSVRERKDPKLMVIGQTYTDWKSIVVDVEQFMNENFPRSHGWKDKKKAIEYLRSQINGPYMTQVIDELSEGGHRDPETENWVEEV